MGTAYPTKKLGDVADFVRGITFKPDDVIGIDTANAVACLRTKNVQSDLDLSDVWGVPASFVKRDEQYLREGDILVSSANSWNLVGKCSWVPKLPYRATIGGFISCLRRISQNLDERYLFHWFSSEPVQALVRNCARKTTNISNLSFDQCLALEIPLPPLEEQKRIAAILDQADDIRRKRQQAIDRMNQLGQAIFHEMFGEWDQQDTKYSTVNLGDKIDFLTSGSRGWAEYYRDSGSTFLRIQNVKRDELDLSDVAYVDAPDTAESKRTRVQSGDVLLSITADLGRTAVIPHDIGDAYISQHLALIRAPAFDPRFLSAALSSPAGQRLILRRNREGVKAGLNFDDVRSVCLPDVPIEVQREFTSRVQTVDEIKIINQSTLTRTSAAFASLQHRAFTGQL